MKIAIIGCPGSGKSTLSFKLQKLLGFPLYHLDQYFWKPGWKRLNRKEFEKIHNQLCDKGMVGLPSEALCEGWIIEGMATRHFEYRAEKADVIIFLDIPRWLCLYRIFKRAFLCFGKVGPASPKGCPERGPSLEFLRYVWDFKHKKRPNILDLIKEYKGIKKVFVIKNDQDISDLLRYFS